MTAKFSHLDADAEEALELPLALRIRDILGDRFISHERINDIFDYADYLMYRPPRSRPAGMAIVGEPGAGKTDLLSKLRDRYPSERARCGVIATRPTLLFSMCSVRDAREFYVRMLIALGCPEGSAVSAREREQLVLKLARACALRLVLVDEIQDVLKGTQAQQTRTLETLRFVMNELNVVLIVAGSEEAELAISLDAHLSSRLKLKRLPKWVADDYLAHFLQAMESSLPLRQPSRLYAQGTMKLIAKLSGGQTDAIATLVRHAAALAISDGEERITHALLERARYEFPRLTSWAHAAPGDPGRGLSLG